MSPGFRHEALVYRDRDEYLAGTVPFLRAGVDAGEPSLVAVSRRNTALLEAELEDAGAVRFVDMESLGRNPARIIPFMQDFLDEQAGAPVRAVSEPLWPGRVAAEVEECQRHESLLNVAFAAAPEWSLLCPFDASALGDEVLAALAHSHDAVAHHGVSEPSSGHEPAADQFAGELPGWPPGVAGFPFERTDLAEVRRRVEEAAEAVGVSSLDVAALVVAASELAANSVAHGGGAGTLRIWTEPGTLLVEVQDGGVIVDPLVGRRRPDDDAGGRPWPVDGQPALRPGPDPLRRGRHRRSPSGLSPLTPAGDPERGERGGFLPWNRG